MGSADKVPQTMVAKRKLLLKRPRKAPASPDRWSQAFLEYLAGECRLSPNTVAAYRRDIRRFHHWLKNRTISRLKIADLSDFVAWLHSLKLAPSSIARHIVAVRMYFRYLQLEGVLLENLAELLGSQKLWQTDPRGHVAHGRESFSRGPPTDRRLLAA